VAPTPGDNQLLAGRQQLAHDLVGVALCDHRTHRHLDAQILAPPAGAVTALPAMAVFGSEQALVAKVHERIEIRIGNQHHISAIAPITAVRSTAGNVLLAPKAHATAAAIACFHTDIDLVDEFHLPGAVSSALETKNPVGDGVSARPVSRRVASSAPR